MGLTEHQIDLLLRSAERLERLPEVTVHEILEQSVVHANRMGKQFIREYVQLVFSDFQCSRFVAVVFRHGVLLSKERPPPVLGIAQPSADPPLLLKISNAIAKM